MMGTIQTQAQDQNFWIFLCFGQSNMAGQAPIEQQDLQVSDRYLSMATTDGSDGRELGTWRKAIPPLCRADAHPTINDIANHYPNTYVVSSEGCLPSDDNVHFSSEGYRQLGRHYALRYLEATNPALAETCRKQLTAAGLNKVTVATSNLKVRVEKNGNVVNVTASEPIDKVDVVSFSGKTVKVFTIAGKSGFELPVAELPKEKLIFVFQNSNGNATADIDL